MIYQTDGTLTLRADEHLNPVKPAKASFAAAARSFSRRAQRERRIMS
ncbi:MAG: hypothetical protein NZ699_05505 [Roseiflexus sp.]|nr:hypothetical protein [Roseiflexus sp.]